MTEPEYNSIIAQATLDGASRITFLSKENIALFDINTSNIPSFSELSESVRLKARFSASLTTLISVAHHATDREKTYHP